MSNSKKVKFYYDLYADLVLAQSGEVGFVIGRAQFLHCEDKYLLRYENASGVLVEQWWGQSALCYVDDDEILN